MMSIVSLCLAALAFRVAAGCADTLASRDCQDVKHHDMCHVYFEECAATCGCDVDWAERRERAGLDDAHYASPDFRCATGAAFADGMDFNCTLYEGARWCAVDAAGDVVEGPGWCSWFNPSNCDVARAWRWPDHEVYANGAGRWGRSCCCDTGLAETYPYDEAGGECADRRNSRGGAWHDPYGYSCRAYHFGSFCTLDGTPGSGWKARDGDLADYVRDRMSPLDACCACGAPARAPAPATGTPTRSPTTAPAAGGVTLAPARVIGGKGGKMGKAKNGKSAKANPGKALL